MSDTESEGREDTWSDRLKRRIKPEWMVEGDKNRPAGKPDWRLGHLLWIMTLGSPAEVDALFGNPNATLKRTGDAVKTDWQERESLRAGKSVKDNACGSER